MTAPKFTAFDDGTPRPAWWEKGILAAYYRLLGSSQKQASAAVGRNERTIRNWEANTAVWTRATQAAKERWLGEVTSLARRQLLKAMMTADGDLSLKLLERLDDALAPPSQRLKHEGGVSLTSQPEWQRLRTQLLETLAAYPEAKLALAALLTGELIVGEVSRNGSSNGTGH
jgi:hypothetical protein